MKNHYGKQELKRNLFTIFSITAKRMLLPIFLFSFCQTIFAQQKITGNVRGLDAKPLYGVTIQVKGKNTSTLTDENGNFSINAGQNETLIFSNVGYATQEVPLNNRTNVDVQLVASLHELDQIVVTGYTRQAKKDITGAVAVVDVNAMKSIPTGTAEQALQGQASGVTVITSGAPGGESNIFIRGVTSFGNTQPLIIVDGIQSSLHDINANDIESIQVLKDAGAAAIYGVRGSNGVIIVTTKRAKQAHQQFPSIPMSAIRFRQMVMCSISHPRRTWQSLLRR
ncbi:MAG TPA: TonB-dependent receptor plug domain-containing protein [Chitinophagaceae bacterium]